MTKAPDNNVPPLQAVVLAGGRGQRMQPYTAEIPKPLVTIGDRPIVEILLTQMKKCGIERVYMAVNHLAHLLMAAIGDGNRWGLEVIYSHEEQPLSTVGPLKLIEGLPTDFIVVNGDVLTDIDFRALFEHHLNSHARLTIATQERTTRIDYGVMQIDAEGIVCGFQEKPTFASVVSMGVYVFSRVVLQLVPEGESFGFDDLVLMLLKRREPVNTYPHDGYWLDVGRPDDYRQANRDIDRIRRLIG